MFGACTQQQPNTNYVARVGDAKLTEQELSRTVGDRGDGFARQVVSNWVTSELLYQEARRRGFPESAEVTRQIEEAKRQLAISAYLENEVYEDDSSGLDDAMLESAFNAGKDAYRLTNDVVNISFAIFEERDAANAFRSFLLRGGKWNDVVQRTQADAEGKQQLLRVATREYFTQSMLYPEELWKIARTLSKEDVSFVVKTNVGYCVAIVHSAQRQGDTPEFEYAKNEIKERIMMDRRRSRYDEVLATLRSKYDVDIHLGSMDSTQINGND